MPPLKVTMSGPRSMNLRRFSGGGSRARYHEIAGGQIRGDDSGPFKMLFNREYHSLPGAHAIGTGATELIHIGQGSWG